MDTAKPFTATISGKQMPEIKKAQTLKGDIKNSKKNPLPGDLPEIAGFRTENREMQTRFHFRMDLCVGCHACEVACSEQNGLPVDTQWRRVGEVQCGTFPDTQNYFLSSGCNHCLDAACMKGCPVDAYEVNDRGIVLHKDDVCIGCGYCTWNCPYSVPVLQADRKIVTKCDMCTNRLDAGFDPACVQACPANAIQIEEVMLIDILNEHLKDGIGPDMPSPEITMPSTKITLPEGMKVEDFHKVDRDIIELEEPHYPLIFMTVLTQLGFGGFVSIFIVDFIRTYLYQAEVGSTLGLLSIGLMAIVGMSLNASTLHLGRPLYAFRALKNFKTSWLSREVIGLSAFAGSASLYAIFLFCTEGLSTFVDNAPFTLEQFGGDPIRMLLGAATVVFGVAGIYCSSKLYRVPARPAWNTIKTTIDFFDVSMILGPAMFIAATALACFWAKGDTDYIRTAASYAAICSFVALVFKASKNAYFIRKWTESDVFELVASAQLRKEQMFRVRMTRNVMIIISLLALATLFPGESHWTPESFIGISLFALTTLTGISFLNRYIFFVTVVPRNIPGNYVMRTFDALKHGKG